MRQDLLREKIEKSGKTITHIASVLDITREGLYNKLYGKTEFKISEMNVLVDELHLTKQERDNIFFGQSSDF